MKQRSIKSEFPRHLDDDFLPQQIRKQCEEIAAATGLRLGTVQSYITRAIRSFKTANDDYKNITMSWGINPNGFYSEEYYKYKKRLFDEIVSSESSRKIRLREIVKDITLTWVTSGDNSLHLSASQRLNLLVDHEREHGEQGLDEFARKLFPNWFERRRDSLFLDEEAPALPIMAPEVYTGLRSCESPPEFIKRVYEPWLGQGLDRAHIRKLDPKLSTAINNWLSRPENVWPADVDLPTRGEQNRRDIETLRGQAPDGNLSQVIGKFTMREATRLRSAAHRDAKKDK